MSTQKIFFSYSRADSPFALTLAKDLREAGADIWIDQLDIPAGSHWDAAVEKALNSSAYVLVILTPSSTASTNVMDEVSFALESGKKIIPVLLEDCLAPFRLRRLQRIDFTSDYTNGFSQLIISLNLSMGADGKSGGIPVENTQINASTPIAPAQDSHEKEKRDNAHWEEACRVNTIVSYRKYLNESPSGLFVDEAKLLIKQLEVEQKEEELEALLWQRAKNENVKTLYQNYLQEHPQGNYKTLALAAIAEFEKAEKEEARRQSEITAQQEKERVQKAKEEKEKEEQLQREQAAKAKEEKDKADQLQREREAKAREEKAKEEQLQREQAAKAKEEREKQLREEKEKADKAKQERERELALEKERARKAKEEREKEIRLEKEKAQREKEEREKAKQQEKEKAIQERLAAGGSATPSGNSKKYALIAGGLLVVCLGIWWMMSSGSGKGDDRKSWMAALQKNDSTAFAQYMITFPSGKYYTKAKERIDSLYWVQKAIQDSLDAIRASNLAIAEPEQQADTTPLVTEPVKTEPVQVPTADPKQKAATPTKPKATTPANKPANTTTKKTSPVPVKVTLGQEYGGGIVIYVGAKGDHGMIVSSKEVGSVDWEKAQKICAAYKVGTFDGWRLPSKDELNIIYQNRKYMGTYTKGGYWSSTEEGKNSAMSQNFTNGNMGKANKQTQMAVRAVRPF